VKDSKQVEASYSRRGMLLSAAGAMATAMLAKPAILFGDPNSAPSSGARPHAAFQDRLTGPIYSNPCPFTADLQPDDAAQKKGIDRAIAAGIGVFATTAGNSKYPTLSFHEIKHVNRVMVEAVDRRALAIMSTGDWELDQTIDFAKFCRGSSADALQVLIPVKLREPEQEDAAVDFYRRVGDAAALPLVLHGKFTDSLLTKLVGLDCVAAMKEDHALEDFVRQQIDHGQRITIFGGGGENRFYIGWPYGAKAYYSTYSTFAPDIAAKVWKVIQSGDIRAAAVLTAKFDYPYIRRFNHGVWHATLELFDIGTRHVRPPHKVLDDAQMAELKAFFESQGVKPYVYKNA